MHQVYANMRSIALLLHVYVTCVALVSARYRPHCDPGRSGEVIVHLFSWTWSDIAKECENVLGPMGFCGVQVSPPNEHRIVTNPKRPWWERYQPISYKLDSASGSRQEFIHMVKRCNAVGVRIYIDAVINHMAGIDAGSGYGSGGSFYNTTNMQFDGVPFGRNDFGTHCSTASGNIENYGNSEQVKNCSLVGLLDLKLDNDYVRNKVVGFLNDTLDIGIDGLRIDAAKHMWPGDIDAILGMTRETIFGGEPFVFQEVIDLYGSEPIKATDYVHLGKVTEFKYGLKMVEIFKNGSTALAHLKTFGSGWGMLADNHSLVFVDNHDNQRGHGGGGNIITYKNPSAYKMAVIFMLSWPYGTPRIMSSYDFHEDWTGPPSGSPGDGATCQNGWICEHRWRQIKNMVAWRNFAGSSSVENWWSNGNNQIAYSRGATSFIAFNKQDGCLDEWLATGLPSGIYCDIISGDVINGQCTGKAIQVGSDSKARIQIDGHSEDPIIAIHYGSKVNDSSNSGLPPQVTKGSPVAPPRGSAQRTIVMIKRQTSVGQNLFLRGGCGGTCTIPISYSPRNGSHFYGYASWSRGDTVLDWLGAEYGQDTHSCAAAQGSPMVWTTSNPFAAGYVSENRFGDHYWMWEAYMDCSQLSNGYFEVKGYLNGEWESDVSQNGCGGAPRNTRNHVARCGNLNVFEWSSGSCLILPLN